MTVKLIKGLPTKAFVRSICDKHGLMIYPLDLYAHYGHVTFDTRAGSNEKAAKVADELRCLGLTVSLRNSDRSKALTGQIKIEREAKQ